MGILYTDSSWEDTFAHAMVASKWPAYDPGLKSLLIPDALLAVTGHRAEAYFDRPSGGSMNADEFSAWLMDHSFHETVGKWTTPRIPIVIQTVQTGASKLNNKYAYAVQTVPKSGK